MAELIRYTPRVDQNTVAMYWNGSPEDILGIQAWLFCKIDAEYSQYGEVTSLTIYYNKDPIKISPETYLIKQYVLKGKYWMLITIQKEEFEKTYMPANAIFNEVSPITR